MLNRKTLGKIQIVLAVIIFIGGIVGLSYTYSAYAQFIEEKNSISSSLIESLDYIKNFSSNETKYLTTVSILTNYQEKLSFTVQTLILGLGFSIIIIILSLILILQGLVNIMEK